MAEDKQENKMKVPLHLALIPDGNRRWAKAKGLPGFKGHEAGEKKFEEILDWCMELGIRMVTVYTLSQENFSRSREEVEFLLKLIKSHIQKFAKDKKVHKNKVRLNVIGNLDLLPQDVKKAAAKAMDATKNYNNYTLNLAVAYGGRQEIIDATKKIAEKARVGNICLGQIDETLFSKNLYAELPDVDLLIRTSEQRLSGFLLWQSAYAEVVFLEDKMFPELTKDDFAKAIGEYGSRERRFGK